MHSHKSAFGTRVAGIKAAVIQEGFLYEDENCRNISDAVKLTVEKMRKSGLEVEFISVPELIEARKVIAVLSLTEFPKIVGENLQPYLGRSSFMLDLKNSMLDTNRNLPQEAKVAFSASKLLEEDIKKSNILEKTINQTLLMAK